MIVRSDNNIAYDNVMTPIYSDRVIADGGTIETLTEVEEVLSDLGDQDVVPSLLWVAEGSKVGKDYSILPNDGSGDFEVTRAGDTAFTQNPDLTWRPALPNEPRFTYENGVKGRLVENAATRLNADPYSIEKPSWTKTGARVEGDPATAGAELITNAADREFSSDTGWWIKVGSLTIAGGSANFIANGDEIRRANAMTLGKMYLVTFTVKEYLSGTLYAAYDGYTGPRLISANGTFTNYIYCYDNTKRNIAFYGSNFVGKLDDVSFKEVSGFDCPFVDANGINTKQGRKLVATANNGSVKLATPVAVTAATSYVNSVYIKRLVGNGTIYLIDVNNTDRAVTVTSEWTRVQYAATATGTTGQVGIKMATAGDEVMICYMPIEAGTVATSPIGGAEGATQTRNADVVAKTNASALIGQAEGTIFVDFNYRSSIFQPQKAIIVLRNTTGYYIYLFIDSDGDIRYSIAPEVEGGTIGGNVVSDAPAGRYKIAFAYKSGDIAIYVNGVSKVVSTGAFTFTTPLSIIDIGNYITSQVMKDDYNSFYLSKTRLPNDTLQTLTTI